MTTLFSTRYPVIYLVITALFAFSMPAESKCGPLKPISAKLKRWVGGIGGRSGVNYTFDFKSSGQRRIVFDTIWIKNEGVFSLKPELTYEGFEINIQSRYDSSNATHTITANRLRIQSKYPTAEELAVLQSKPAPNPFKIKKAQAVVSYRCGSKKYLAVITEIKELEKVMYP